MAGSKLRELSTTIITVLYFSVTLSSLYPKKEPDECVVKRRGLLSIDIDWMLLVSNLL